MRKDTPFSWTVSQDNSFNQLKNVLTTAPILIFPDFSKTFYLYTDASDIALGAILAQLDSHGINHPISFYSKSFSRAERNYSVTNCECLAVIL